MPVPRVAPTLIMVSCSTPKLRTSRGAAVAGFGFADQLSDRLAAKQLRGQSGTAGWRPVAVLR